MKFWLTEASTQWKTLWRLTGKADFVHSCIATDIWRPTAFFSIVSSLLQKRKTLFVVDIDFRNTSWMYYKTGTWSFKSYILCHYIYDMLRILQVKLAVYGCDLVLLKSRKMVKDFGKDKSHVRNFFDTAHSQAHIIPYERLNEKLLSIRDKNRPLRLVYFGRFVEYKGLDKAIRSVVIASKRSCRPIELHLIGTGAEKERLSKLTHDLSGEKFVHFHEPIPYGPELFKTLYQYDLALATPLVEDTPRSAFDSMASGIPILAFDIVYYNDLKEESGAVRLASWPDENELASAIVDLENNRESIVKMAKNGYDFAHQNTQEKWLKKRIDWTLDLFSNSTHHDGIGTLEARLT